MPAGDYAAKVAEEVEGPYENDVVVFSLRKLHYYIQGGGINSAIRRISKKHVEGAAGNKKNINEVIFIFQICQTLLVARVVKRFPCYGGLGEVSGLISHPLLAPFNSNHRPIISYRT